MPSAASKHRSLQGKQRQGEKNKEGHDKVPFAAFSIDTGASRGVQAEGGAFRSLEHAASQAKSKHDEKNKQQDSSKAHFAAFSKDTGAHRGL